MNMPRAELRYAAAMSHKLHARVTCEILRLHEQLELNELYFDGCLLW